MTDAEPAPEAQEEAIEEKAADQSEEAKTSDKTTEITEQAEENSADSNGEATPTPEDNIKEEQASDGEPEEVVAETAESSAEEEKPEDKEDKKANSRLGRGLDALFGDDKAAIDDPTVEQSAPMSNDDSDDEGLAGVVLMPIELLKPGKFQPRQNFDTDRIEELATSIKKHGVLQPLLVRKISADQDEFEIIAGERRWRASQQANLHEVPVIIQEFEDSDALEIGLIENLQREDLSALEEAAAYKKLMEEFGHTQEKLGEIIGKSRSHIANTIRLLNLPPFVQECVDKGELTVGHARTLLGAKNPEELAKKIIKESLNVRQAEALVYGHLGKEDKKEKPASDADQPKTEEPKQRVPKAKSADIVAIEQDMSNMLGIKVELEPSTDHRGRIVLHYDNLDQFDDVLRRLAE